MYEKLKLPGKGHPRSGRKLKLRRERRGRTEVKFDRWWLRGLSSFPEKWVFGERRTLKGKKPCCVVFAALSPVCCFCLLKHQLKPITLATHFGIRFITFSFWMWYYIEIGHRVGARWCLALLESHLLTFLRLSRRADPSWQKCKVQSMLGLSSASSHSISAHSPRCHWPLSCPLGLAPALTSPILSIRSTMSWVLFH